MKIQAFIRTKYERLTVQQRRVAIFITATLGIVIIMVGCQAIAAHHKVVPPDPIMVRQGNQIIIPANSPLRAQIEIQTVRLNPVKIRDPR